MKRKLGNIFFTAMMLSSFGFFASDSDFYINAIFFTLFFGFSVAALYQHNQYHSSTKNQ